MQNQTDIKIQPNSKHPLKPGKKRTGSKLTESQFGFLLLLPALMIFTFIIFYPFINSIIMSFTDYSLLKADRIFVGLENYINMFKDPNFLGVLKNTLVFVVGGTMIPFLVGLVWAIVLNLSLIHI